MLIREFQDQDATKLAAIGQFLLRRADDTASKKTISVNAFLKLAQQNGINLTAERLQTMALRPPLNNIIATIQNDEIVFKGGEEEVGTPEKMSVDQARKTVNQMAKRAIDLK